MMKKLLPYMLMLMNIDQMKPSLVVLIASFIIQFKLIFLSMYHLN
jgi:hypothetical protein